MFVQKLTKRVKIGYSISLFFAILTAISGYAAYRFFGELDQLVFGIFTLCFVLFFIGLSLHGDRTWRHLNEGKGSYSIRLKSPVRFKRSAWMHRYAEFIAFWLRLSMSAGFVPVLIGKPCSGKTLILEKVTPGLVYGNKSLILEKTSPGASLSVLKLQDTSSDDLESSINQESYFSIEELSHFDAKQVNELFMAVSDKHFAISTQDYSILKRFGFEQAMMQRRKLIVFLD
ncbi:MAG: hypothetical protein ACTS9Y_00685 [Methylophilus sp.]|uniref:hypothetical protein n=1 Tax=Methylophilus sp. TaxID=29541 RepID=UPI003FA071DC